ncbi:Nn.00g019570.m01.CDS01 [Neocucurbitaria sp. VM-36]
MNDIRGLMDLILDNLRGLYPQAENYSIITYRTPGESVVAQAILFIDEEQTKWELLLSGDAAITILDAFEQLFRRTQRELGQLIDSGDHTGAWNGSEWER